MVPSCQSRFTFLAAGRVSAAADLPTISPKTRVGVFRRHASGRLSSRGRDRSMFTPGSRVCAYKTASGLGKWLNRDPIGERGGLNLYAYVANNPISNIDPLGLDIWVTQEPAGGWWHQRVVGNNQNGGYWETDFTPQSWSLSNPLSPVTAQGNVGYAPNWLWPLNNQPDNAQTVCHVRTTPDVDKLLQQQAQQNSDNPPPRYTCVGGNCWNYANNFVNQANTAMNPVITVPPSFNTVVNTPVLYMHL